MPGVAYHMNDMESNGLSVVQIARNFIASPEFKTQYGENPTEDEYINLLYIRTFWEEPLDSLRLIITRKGLSLVQRIGIPRWCFLQSHQKMFLVAPQIEDGIWMPF